MPPAKALLEGGIDVIELTLWAPIVLKAVKLIREQVPEIIVGVGTIFGARDGGFCFEAFHQG